MSDEQSRTGRAHVGPGVSAEDAALLTQSWFDGHGPGFFKDQYGVESWSELNRQIHDGPYRVTAMMVDIRRSTDLMRESIDLEAHTLMLGAFVRLSMVFLRGMGWWFDHFTGDGFLAYRIHTRRSIELNWNHNESIEAIMRTCATLHAMFLHEFWPRMMSNTSVLLPDMGLAIGLDSGPRVAMQNVGDAIIVTGRPIVEAARMVGAARNRETVLNGQIAADLNTHVLRLFPAGEVTVGAVPRDTKEHPMKPDGSGGQVMLVASMSDAWLSHLWEKEARPVFDVAFTRALADADARLRNSLQLPAEPIPPG